MQTALNNAVHRFESPVREIDRAQRFYEALLGKPLRREPKGADTLAVFDADAAGVGGCLLARHGARPADAGTVVYLNAGPALDPVLARVEPAGGRIDTPKTVLPDDIGCFALITDSEGNRVGLHAPK